MMVNYGTIKKMEKTITNRIRTIYLANLNLFAVYVRQSIFKIV